MLRLAALAGAGIDIVSKLASDNEAPAFSKELAAMIADGHREKSLCRRAGQLPVFTPSELVRRSRTAD
jgi:hypothetical protein